MLFSVFVLQGRTQTVSKSPRNRYDSIERKGFNEEDYRSMDWTHVQAFNNGRLSVIREILSYLISKENKL